MSPRTLHVCSTSVSDLADGTSERPFSTVSAAAAIAHPGDTVRVAGGTYREQVDPPCGGTDHAPITYVAAGDEHVVITGSDVASEWEHVSAHVWRYQIESTRFGAFNPYVDVIRGDWFDPLGRVHHTGCVYRNGEWLVEAAALDELFEVAHPEGLWFAQVDGDADRIISLGGMRPDGGPAISADRLTFRYGGTLATTPEGSTYSTGLKVGDWLRFDQVEVGDLCQSIEIDVAADQGGGGRIEFRLDTPDGPLLGICDVAAGDPDSWQTLTVPLAPCSGTISLVARLTTADYEVGTTTIYAQFPGGDPNDESVEINVRQTVFYPSRNFIDNIHVSGFTLRNAATNWAPPSSEQKAVIGTNWSRGWVIENNTISHSKCSGLSLGKYGDGTDNTNDAGAADPYTRCVRDALEKGWNRSRVGSHQVRDNHIHHCEQTGIVGSMGCAFSVVTGNEIHDINSRRLFSGAEQAGLKFHGAVDTVISGNCVYRTALHGIWLDWMCQGAQVTANLLHDNTDFPDLFLEMQHGPLLVANNVMLSKHASFINSKGMAFVHNLIVGHVSHFLSDTRLTPYHRPRDTALAGLADSTPGDHRFYNNIVLSPEGAATDGSHATWNGTLDGGVLPSFAAGNVFANGATPSMVERNAVVATAEVRAHLQEQPDGWFLHLDADPAWSATPRQVVTTELLGRAAVPDVPFDDTDGKPLAVDTDYLGAARDPDNPYPGPFEGPASGPIRVWPIQR